MSTCGSIIKRASRLSGVEDFFRPDKEELLSIDMDKDPDLKLLVPDGVRGEETLEDALLSVLRPVELSSVGEGTFFKEEGRDVLLDVADLTEDFCAEFELPLSDFADKRGTGAFGLIEGSEALLLSVELCFPGSKTEGETFFPSTEAPFSGLLIILFSEELPVLFLL